MVDDEFGRDERVDLGRVAAERLHGLAHRGQIHHGGHAGQVLQDDPGRGELDLGVGFGGRVPARQRGYLAGGDVGAVLVAEEVLQQDLQAEREAGRTFRSVQPVDLVPLARDLKGRPAAEAVRCHRVQSLLARISAVPRWYPTYSISISSYLARGSAQEILTSSYSVLDQDAR